MNVIDFSKKTLVEMTAYFAELSGESEQIALAHLSSNGLYGFDWQESDLPILMECAVRTELWNQHGLSLEEFMSETFAGIRLDDLRHQGDKFRNWEELVQNPRASRMSGAGTDKKLVAENKLIKASNGTLPEDFAELDYDNQRKILDGRQVHHVVSRMVDCGSPILSVRPIAVGKDPCYDENTGEKLHTPGHDRVECVALKSFVHLAPVIRTISTAGDSAGAFSDITGGGRKRKVLITGFTEVIKSRQCGEVGKIVVGGEVRDLIEESRLVADEMLGCEIAGHSDEIAGLIYKTWLENCSLGAWYKERGLDGWKSVLKAYSGGTLKLARSPSLDNRKMAERSLKFQQGAVDRKIMEISGLSDRLTSADWLAGNYPEIPAHVRLEHEAEARKMLAISYTARLMRDHKKLQNPTHGKLRSKQTKMRVGDKSCTVNGARTGECVAWFATMRLSVEGEVFWEGVVDRYDLLKEVERLGADSGGVLGFDWENYARDMLEIGALNKELKQQDIMDFKPSHSSQVLSTKQNREMLAEVMIRRMTQYSLEDSLCGKSPWVLLDSEGLYNGEVIDIEFKAAHCESEVVAEIVDAMRRVELAGEPVNRRTVSSAMKRKGAWELLIAENQKANGTLPDISSGNLMKAAYKAA